MLATVTLSAQTLVAATSGASASYPNQGGIQLYAPSTNSGTVFVGKTSSVAASGATTAGLPVEAGKAIQIPPGWASDANAIYVIADITGQSLYWDPILKTPTA